MEKTNRTKRFLIIVVCAAVGMGVIAFIYAGIREVGRGIKVSSAQQVVQELSERWKELDEIKIKNEEEIKRLQGENETIIHEQNMLAITAEEKRIDNCKLYIELCDKYISIDDVIEEESFLQENWITP